MLGASFALGMVQLTGAGPAVAHNDHAGDRIVIDAVTPAAAGVSVRPVTGGFGKLELRTRGRTSVTVLGSAGQPILRVGPPGADANLAAPEWYRDNEPLGIAPVPSVPARDRPARWKRVSTQPAWQWFDHRLHPQDRRIRDWSIPLRVTDAPRASAAASSARPGQLQLVLDDPEPLPGVRVRGLLDPGLLAAAQQRGQAAGGGHGAGRRALRPRRARRRRGQRPQPRVAAHGPVRQPVPRPDPVIDPRASPRMTLLRRDPALTWVDPRLEPLRLPPAPAAGEPAVVARRWRIRLRAGGRAATIAGTTRLTAPPPAEKRPVATPAQTAPPNGGGDGGDGFDWVWVAGAVLGVAALAAGWRVGRR